jgi:hypothetical protein
MIKADLKQCGKYKIAGDLDVIFGKLLNEMIYENNLALRAV